jgi:hypothetical protein
MAVKPRGRSDRPKLLPFSSTSNPVSVRGRRSRRVAIERSETLDGVGSPQNLPSGRMTYSAFDRYRKGVSSMCLKTWLEVAVTPPSAADALRVWWLDLSWRNDVHFDVYRRCSWALRVPVSRTIPTERYSPYCD